MTKDKGAALLKLNRGAELVAQLEDALGANAVWDALAADARHQIRIGARSTDPLELAGALEEMAEELREMSREQAAEAETVRRHSAAEIVAAFGEGAADDEETGQ
ncbi:hypothetical protein [Gordonia alkaliphila]|uniref:Uncharacterized protein n=1 Tax=Gordonia alkaliphila TaxID=1053547 RepID=A0ABP8ZD76_9ACTN